MTDKSLLKFLEYIKPEEDFDISKSPLEPDYLDKNNWAALPEIDGQQFYIPDNSFDVVKVNNPVDVFYIHPTGYFEKRWNSNMDKNRAACERTEIMLGNQASAFNDSCNIYAPEYRQATYYSFFDANKNGKEALDLAYSDIERAFDYFIDNFNDNRPFIIAAHSQGALISHKLINKKVDDTNLQKRFICAYAIGYMIPEIYYNEVFPNIKKSESYNDTNCIISWSTIVEGFKRNREKTLFWKPSGWSVEPMKQKIISTNPFSWTNDNKWHLSNNNKSIINKAQNYDFADRLRVEHTGEKKSIGLTRIQEFSALLNSETGLLETKGPLIENIKKMRYFNGDLHSFDVMLFWGTLRQNIKDRISAFI
tara:strand:+ start:654 stop:1748 length:1095 start_codon:yes stop_codon:yes gene_type:complete